MPGRIAIEKHGFKDFINSFSLLVVFGSVSTAWFFAGIFHASPGYWFYHLLGTTVWAIYTIDHLLDGLNQDQSSLSLRHRVHVHYKKPLFVLVVLIVLTNGFIAPYYLPQRVMFYGFGLAAFVGAYLVLVHILVKNKRFFGKEIAIAIGVTGGMALLPAVHGNFVWNWSNAALLLLFTTLNLTNLLIFAYFDHENDLRSGYNSMVQVVGARSTRNLISILPGILFLGIGLWAFGSEMESRIYVVIVFLLMMHVLALIMLRENTFVHGERYRFWGDFIYLIPGAVFELLMAGG